MMVTNYFSRFLRKSVFLGLTSAICSLSLVASQSPQRIHSQINDEERVKLTGNVRPSLVYAKDQGSVVGSLSLPEMTMHFAMSAAQRADLLQLVQQQQNRHSTQFHKFLTPEQYADRFGMSEKDVEKVSAWLQTQGFSNIQSARSRTFITFSGTAAQAQSAFGTSIHNYLTANGANHYANTTDPELPKALSGIVESIRGLHDFHPRPHIHSHFTSSVSGNHYLTPDDWATIYDVKALYNSGIDGTGVKIAIPGQTDLVMADIETFQTNSGLAVKYPLMIPAGIDPGVVIGDLGESDLDIEWAGGIAKGATIVFVTSSDVITSETYAVDNNVANILAITYGDCESDTGAATENSLSSLFQQAIAQGMTVVAASGDQGAADCDGGSTLSYATQGLSVDVPAAIPYVTAVGGTEFNEGSTTGGTTYWNSTDNANNGSALSYIPETSWNDSAIDNALSASGGGSSILYSKPTWQTGTGVPNDSKRDVPDLALSSSADHDGYLTCTETGTNTTYTPTCVVGFRVAASGNLNVTGGTSAASPTFAAIVAMIVQKYGPQGLINPNLYSLASISSNAFHDITSGNNVVPCQVLSSDTGCTAATGAVVGSLGTLGYSATPGYDQVTGLGSIDAFNLVEQWMDDFKMSPSVTALTINPGSSGTANINVSPFGSFTGNISFTCTVSSGITNTTCSIPGTVSGGSGSVTLTITAASNANVPWWKTFPRIPPHNQPLVLFALLAFLLATNVYLMTRRRRFQIPGLALTVLMVVGLSGCGGSSSSGTTTTSPSTPTPASVTGTVTVTGTSGSLTNSTIITLTIP